MSASDNSTQDSLRKTVVKSIPLVFLVSALTVFFYKFGWFQWIENATLDLTARTKSLDSGVVYIVDITDDDYQTVFNGQSPLNQEKLHELLVATASGDPKVIVLDLEVEPSSTKVFDLPDYKGTIVVAAPVEALDDDSVAEILKTPVEGLPLLPTCARTVLVPKAVPQSKAVRALPFIPRDHDGYIRRYCRRLNTVESASSKDLTVADSLPWAVATAFKPELKEKNLSESNEVFLAFAKNQKDLLSIPASEVLASKGAEGLREIIGNKIAIIGGTYKEGRDVYKTAAGTLPGVSIVAQAVETELQFGGIKAVNEIWLLVAQLVASFVFVIINYKFRDSMIPLIGLIAIPFAAIVFSLVSFQTHALWASFIPVLFAVQFHALFNHVSDVRKRNVELKVANENLVKTRKELARAIDQGGQEERKRIAAGLHDETLMYLFEVETAIDELREDDSKKEVYERTHKVLQKTRKSVRDVMNNLYPTVLRDHGLSPAIRTITESISSSDLKFEFEDNFEQSSIPALDHSAQVRIYKVVQNALRNTIEHSEAQKCIVRFEKDDNRLLVQISDDGKGFTSLDGRTDSQGVRNMKEYAELLDGSIEWITPSKRFGKGTDVVLSVPYRHLTK